MELLEGKKGFIFITLLAFINIYSSSSYPLSMGVTILEYGLLYYYIVIGRYDKAFMLYLVFMSVSLEMDAFIFIEGKPTFERWSFYNPSSLFKFTILLLFILMYMKYKNKIVLNTDTKKFSIWMKIVLWSGLISILLGMLLNDNGILSSGLYPAAITNPLIYFLGLLSLFGCTIIMCSFKDKKIQIEELCKTILLGVSVAAILSMLLGYKGYYGFEEMMLAPMLSGFAPFVLVFIRDAKKKEKILNFAIFVLIVFLAFSHPNVVGSKWYIIISAALLYLIYSYMPNKSPIFMVILAVLMLYLIPVLSEFLMEIMSTSDFNKWKFSQVMKTMDITSYTSLEAWFLDLDTSAKFRVDEPMNIAIEYFNKPWFALFGKGIAGTTLHYTPFCDWNDSAAFLTNQTAYGFYSEMHESTSVLFLRHGIAGIIFLVSTIIMLLKKIKYSPFAMWGIVWLLFYWSYGNSFRLGAVALIIALMSERKENVKI